MQQIGPMLAAPAKLAQMYAERLIVGVDAAQFARLARPGGVVLRSNHAAFVFGHLSLYPARVLVALGQPVGTTAAPPTYDALFKGGVECEDDLDGTRYPPMSELTSFFLSAHRTAAEAAERAPDEDFARPNPAEGRMRELFPTVGAVINFYLSGHVQVHLGQVSVWRRAMGLPPA